MPSKMSAIRLQFIYSISLTSYPLCTARHIHSAAAAPEPPMPVYDAWNSFAATVSQSRTMPGLTFTHAALDRRYKGDKSPIR